MKFLIVIPAFNEEKNLGKLLERISLIFPLKNVLVVDDGSSDKTSLIAKNAGSRIFRFEKNQGKGLALRAGFDFAIKNDFEAVLTMDADGQHDPNEIPKFINHLTKFIRNALFTILSQQNHFSCDLSSGRDKDSR
ncbi:MAG: glycosyltransferase family 2 protein [candidate division WOR-3 bacterium]